MSYYRRKKPLFYSPNKTIPDYAQIGSLNRVKELIRAKADLDARGNDNSTGLFWACYNEFYEIAYLLIDAGANPNIPGFEGDTPLHTACDYENLELVKKLLLAGADPNAANNNGDTPLHVACVRGDLSVVKELLKAGSDPYIVGFRNRTPLQIILRSSANASNHQIHKLLKGHISSLRVISIRTIKNHKISRVPLELLSMSHI